MFRNAKKIIEAKSLSPIVKSMATELIELLDCAAIHDMFKGNVCDRRVMAWAIEDMVAHRGEVRVRDLILATVSAKSAMRVASR